jgi:glycosyltransferase involved in cell wall biosynthesis
MRDGVDLELTLAGDGPEHSSLSKLGADLGFNGRLRMPGHVWDVMPLLSSADIFVNPSRTECMPNTLLEAMSAGVPIVATNVGGVGELIRDGVDGLLCPPADPVVLAKAIKQLVDDRVLAQRLADSAYDRVVNEFSFDRRMERIMDLYFHTANLPNCHS